MYVATATDGTVLGRFATLREATNAFGTTKSGQFTITIDTQGPTIPPSLMLNPRDDTGVPGDGVTAKPRPRLVGVIKPRYTRPV